MENQRKLRQGEDEGNAQSAETDLRNGLVVVDRVQKMLGGEKEGRNSKCGEADPTEHVGRSRR